MQDLIKGDLIIYEDENDKIEIEAFLYDETIWLPLNKIAELFEKNKMTISEHIKNIYNEGELDKTSTIRNFLTVQNEGNRTVKNDFITAPSEVPDEVVKTIEEALSTNDKKDNYKINNPWFFGSKDKIYRGTVYIPITQNQNQAIIAAG